MKANEKAIRAPREWKNERVVQHGGLNIFGERYFDKEMKKFNGRIVVLRSADRRDEGKGKGFNVRTLSGKFICYIKTTNY